MGANSGGLGGHTMTVIDRSGRERPVSVTYRANVPLTNHHDQTFVGTSGTARIRVGSQSRLALSVQNV